MTDSGLEVIGGVDTHGRTHHGAVIDSAGRLLGDVEFTADAAGYRQLRLWIGTFGTVVAVGVEGTGTYGAGLARDLSAHGVRVVEVDRPDRRIRRSKGKSDPIDAIAAARGVLAGTSTGIPKTRTGPVEAIRVLRVARRGAIKARTAAINQIHGLVIAAPEDLRAGLGDLTTGQLINRAAAFRVDHARVNEPMTATKTALRSVARRVQDLDEEIQHLDSAITEIIAALAPTTLALRGVGPQVAAQLVVTVGDNPERLRSDAALAHLCGVSPLPVSSGRTDRHRLNRAGDRQANNALYTVVLSRMHYDPATRAYVERRIHQGLTKKEIIRCLKRYVIREIHATLIADFNRPITT